MNNNKRYNIITVKWVRTVERIRYMDNNTVNFRTIVTDIEKRNILLPDFQRGFVWTGDEEQKKIVASVLAKLPIGSILELESSPEEYSSRIIGTHRKVDTSDLKSKVSFLLDGQQRVTVLTNAFSNVIFDNCEKASDLIHTSLKRRFFLCIPRWRNCYFENAQDWFGVKTLTFPIENPDSDVPEFLSGDMYKYIRCEKFNFRDDKSPLNPNNGLSTELDTYCIEYPDYYRVPLFLLIPSKKKATATKTRYATILELISYRIVAEIEAYYAEIKDSPEALDSFLKALNLEDDSIRNIITGEEALEQILEELRKVWRQDFDKYLSACIENMYLNIIKVSEDQRERAIDIYENLNRGGISLSTFDLIIAKVAKIDTENYRSKLAKTISSKQSYDTAKSFVSAALKPSLGDGFNASTHAGCLGNNKEDISGKYIDAFLDVLCLYCNNKEFDADTFDNVAFIKRKEILALDPQDIYDNTQLVCTALDRAFFFLETRCGIRTIKDINYNLQLVVIATIFLKDAWFDDVNVHNKLEAWYWATIFSGVFDKDQNSVAVYNIKRLVKLFDGSGSDSWIRDMSSLVFAAPYYSEKDFLLMRKTSEGRAPKIVFRSFICQFLLSQTYLDMFDPGLRIHALLNDAGSLEAHHIVPLGSATNYGESTEKLRNDSGNVLNSPLNFVYITQAANGAISDDDLDKYVAEIQPAAKSVLGLNGFISPIDDQDKIESFLESRFDWMKGIVDDRISTLLS